jgi:hypothetical protein
MRFAEPHWLFLLGVAPLLVLAYLLARRRPGPRAGRGATSPRPRCC